MITWAIKLFLFISTKIVHKYDPIRWFKFDPHHLKIQAKHDPNNHWVQCKFLLNDEEFWEQIDTWDDY